MQPILVRGRPTAHGAFASTCRTATPRLWRRPRQFQVQNEGVHPTPTPRASGKGLRRAELLAAISLAIDLGLGQPMEHMLRSSLIAARIAERRGLDAKPRATVYYETWVGGVVCTADP